MKDIKEKAKEKCKDCIHRKVCIYNKYFGAKYILKCRHKIKSEVIR